MIMKYLGRSSVLPILLASVIAIGPAIAADIRATGDVSFESGVFSSEPEAEVKQQAISNAVLNAWKRYTSGFSPAQLNAYKKSQTYILANLDEFVIDKVILDQGINKETNTFSVVVKVSFNDVAVQSKLDEGNPKTGVVGGSKSIFTFLFLGREPSSVRTFDARRTDITSETDSEDASEKTTLRGSSGRVENSREITHKVTTGGSTLRKAAEKKYMVFPSTEIDAAVSEVVGSHGFEVSPYADIVAQCKGPGMDQFKKEFTNSDELSPELRMKAIDAAKLCESDIRFFAIGNLDVRMADTDPVTGLTRTSVSFRGWVWDITRPLSRSAATVGPIQKFGLGPDDDSAKSAALRAAASEGAEEIVNQLNARQLH
jgi:hypothetical protein